MKNLVRLSVLAFSALGLLSTSSAYAGVASNDYFTLTDTLNSTVYVFAIPVPSTPSYTAPTFGLSAFSGVTYLVNGTTETDGTVGFFNTAGGGGVALQDSLFNILDATYGAQVFTGTISAPVFTLGTYPETDVNGNPIGTLVISATPPTPATAATPEPSGIALLGTGALGLAGIIRRRLAC